MYIQARDTGQYAHTYIYIYMYIYMIEMLVVLGLLHRELITDYSRGVKGV